MYLTKVYKQETKIIKTAPKFIFPLYFDNKGLDFIKINQILRKEEIKTTRQFTK